MTADSGAFTARARRDCRRIDPPLQRRITDALGRLVDDPPKATSRRPSATAWPASPSPDDVWADFRALADQQPIAAVLGDLVEREATAIAPAA